MNLGYYSNHAGEDLERCAHTYRKAGYPASAAFVEWGRFMLHMAVKFKLPDYGELFDHDGFSQAEVELFKLPYPCVAAEFACPEQIESTNPYHSEPVYKRIVLAVASDLCPVKYERPGAVIIPINYNYKRKTWVMSLWAIMCEYDSAMRIVPTIYERKDMEDKYELKTSKTGWTLRQAFLGIGEIGHIAMRELEAKEMNVGAAIAIDCATERNAVVQMCAALACKNVHTERIRAPEPMQRKRAHADKLPFYDYHVLTIGSERDTHQEGHRGVHSSPRLHLRRGHIRRLHETMRPVWVSAHMVGSAMLGQVNKSYVVERA